MFLSPFSSQVKGLFVLLVSSFPLLRESLPHTCSDPQPVSHVFAGGRCVLLRVWRTWAFCWNERWRNGGGHPATQFRAGPTQCQAGIRKWTCLPGFQKCLHRPLGSSCILPGLSPSYQPSWLFRGHPGGLLCTAVRWAWPPTGKFGLLLLFSPFVPSAAFDLSWNH